MFWKNRKEKNNKISKWINNNIFSMKDVNSKLVKFGQSSGVQGTVLFCKMPGSKSENIAIKLVKIPDFRKLGYNTNIFSKKMLENYEVWLELANTLIVSELVKQQINPHFVDLYRFCIDSKSKKLVLFEEFIEQDKAKRGIVYLEDFVRSGDPRIIMNILFQLLAGICSLQYNGMVHSDLHPGNIFVERTGTGSMGYWVYKINHETYYLPDMGYRIYIGDYGRIWTPGKIKLGWYHGRYSMKQFGYYPEDFDIYKITENLLKGIKDPSILYVVNYLDALFVPTKRKKSSSPQIDDIIEIIFGKFFLEGHCETHPWNCYYIKPPGKKLGTFNLDKKLNLSNLPKELQTILK